MHEMSVCISLLQQVEKIAAEHEASGVAKILLKIGPLSGVEAELLRRAYPIAVAGTVAENAELVIEASEVVVRCSQCDHTSNVPSNRLVCGECGDFRTQVVSGDEMILQSVELDGVSLPARPA
ncbi:MAG: hydrogenase maturation nickel metallochaperone HypA [Gammaproteobacteria bacterium]|nr:hydrogenase maturation nickel metallochaperone HypA [Gammaproteobacteria bacterium]